MNRFTAVPMPNLNRVRRLGGSFRGVCWLSSIGDSYRDASRPRYSPVETKPKPGMAQDLLADWRAAERESDGARTAVEVAGLAVETADAAKAAAAQSEAAVTAAGEAVERAKEASDLARTAATHATKAAQLIHAEAAAAEERAVETVDEADAGRSRAANAFRDAQARGFRPEGD